MSSKSDPAFNIDHLGNLAFKVVVHVEKKTGWVGRTGTVGKALRLRLVEQVVRRVVEPALQILWARVLHLRPVALAQRHRKAVLVLRHPVLPEQPRLVVLLAKLRHHPPAAIALVVLRALQP